jgi:hypothetical protein
MVDGMHRKRPKRLSLLQNLTKTKHDINTQILWGQQKIPE